MDNKQKDGIYNAKELGATNTVEPNIANMCWSPRMTVLGTWRS